MANEIISISNPVSNQPVMIVTMDVTMHMKMYASKITQSNIQHTVIKIINTIQIHLVKFNIKTYKRTDRLLYHVITITPNFLTVKISLDFFSSLLQYGKLKLTPVIENY